MAFFAIIWSLWLWCNDMIFNDTIFDFKQIIDTIKFRIASWFKAKWPECPNIFLDVVNCPSAI